MTYRERPPHPALRALVDRFWVRTADAVDPSGATAPAAMSPAATAQAATAQAATPLRVLPDGCIDVLIDVPSGDARVVGAMTRAVVHDGVRVAATAAVRFRPGGAHAFLRVPAAQLTDRVVSVLDLDAGWLCARSGGATVGDVVAELERSLLERLGGAVLDRHVGEATRRLLSGHAPSIDALARELDCSRQHLGRSFREHVGLSPKEFARIARLQRALDHVQTAPSAGLAGAALDLGYYDQAHMTRDFNDLAGLTPSRARAAKGSIFPIRSLWLDSSWGA